MSKNKKAKPVIPGKPIVTKISEVADVERELRQATSDAALDYVKKIEAIASSIANKKVKHIPLKTIVYNKDGEKLGVVRHSKWDVAATNQYNMPIGFSLNYEILSKENATSHISHSGVYTKEQILKLLESKITKIKRGRS